MKHLSFLFICAVALIMTSCGSDDCEMDLSGTYVGTETIGLVDTQDATIVISGTDGSYVANGGTLENLALEQNGCTIRHETSALGITSERVEFVVTDSTLSFERFLLGISTSTFSGVKQ